MAIIDTYDTIRTRSAIGVGNPFAALVSAFQGAIAHQKERRSLARLSRLPDHVVRDMGFDPDKVAAELEGTWDEVEPTRFQLR